MTRTYDTEKSNSTTVNIGGAQNFYIIDAVASTTYNYNLPLIVCDGMRYILMRIDTQSTATVNLNAFIGNDILTAGGISITTMLIILQRHIELFSENQRWYVLDRRNDGNSAGSRYSASLVGNNASPKIIFPNNTIFLQFPFIGTIRGDNIDSFVITFETSKASTYTIGLYNPASVTPISIATGTTVASATPYPQPIIKTLSVSEKANLPTSYAYLYFQLTAVNTDFGICTIVIY